MLQLRQRRVAHVRRPGLEQADSHARVLAQPRRDDANSGAAAHLKVGDEVELKDEQTEEQLDVLIDVLTAVYRTVAVQVLKKPADRLMFGPHRADGIRP